jgi:hypothetical protein
MAANKYVKAVFKAPNVLKIADKIENLKVDKKNAISQNRKNYQQDAKKKKNKAKFDKLTYATKNGGAYIPEGLNGANLSAGQKRNSARLKEVQAIASILKAKNPKLSHTKAVSKAWKQM